MWFTEDPWTPMVLCVVAAIVLVGIWSSRQRALWLVLAGACLLGAIGIYFVERSIVTDRERITEKITQLAEAFQKNDRAATLAFFTRQPPTLRELVSSAIDVVDVHGDLSIKDVAIEIYNENSQADSTFRANGTFSIRTLPPTYHPSRWRVRWQKEDDDWKIVDVQRLSIIGDKQLEPFDSRE